MQLKSKRFLIQLNESITANQRSGKVCWGRLYWKAWTEISLSEKDYDVSEEGLAGTTKSMALENER